MNSEESYLNNGKIQTFQYRLGQDQILKQVEKMHQEDNEYYKQIQDYHKQKIKEHQYKFKVAPPVIVFKNQKKDDIYNGRKNTFKVFERNLNKNYLNPDAHPVKIIEPLNANEGLEEVLRKTQKAQLEVKKIFKKKDNSKIFFPDFWSFDKKKNILHQTQMLEIERKILLDQKIKKYQPKTSLSNNFNIQLQNDDIASFRVCEIYGLKPSLNYKDQQNITDNQINVQSIKDTQTNNFMETNNVKVDYDTPQKNHNQSMTPAPTNNSSKFSHFFHKRVNSHETNNSNFKDNQQNDYQLQDSSQNGNFLMSHQKSNSQENLQKSKQILMKKLILPKNSYNKIQNEQSTSDEQQKSENNFLKLNYEELNRIKRKKHLRQLSTPRTADTKAFSSTLTYRTPQNSKEIQIFKLQNNAKIILSDCEEFQEENDELKNKVDQGIYEMFFEKSHKQKQQINQIRIDRIKQIIKADVESKKQDFRVFYEQQKKKLRDMKRRQKYVDID